MGQLQNLEALFHELIELPADQRDRRLAALGAASPDLRRELEGLLAGDQSAGTDGRLSSRLNGATAAPANRAGMQLGPYKLLEEIGEGGFGVVYMAEQSVPFRRRVALKVIKFGMDTRQVITRFEAERQALALMDHSNIARVLDAGAAPDGRPYFVMELVRGEPITKFCAHHKLGLPERLELFTQVCHAVQHAHQKGIIHRDLKPSNVLVALSDIGGGKPVPKIIDFGIAKATGMTLTDKTLFTEFRQFIGTPEYMSPEQAEMTAVDIDTRSDVYSLGVLLYELLTGAPPFDPRTLRSAGVVEMQRIIREVEPPRPSLRVSRILHRSRSAPAAPQAAVPSAGVLVARPPPAVPVEKAAGADDSAAHHLPDAPPPAPSRALRGELDWIVMKALEKDRTRRYATALALAEDVERHRADQPVLAGPPSAAYRVAKFVKRYRAAVIVAALFTLVLLGATVASTLAMLHARQQRNEARAAQARTEQEKTRAENEKTRAAAAEAAAAHERDEARQARDAEAAQRRQAELQARIAGQVTDFTTEVLALADPRFALRPDASVRELLDYAGQNVETKFQNNPLAEARIRATIGKAYVWLDEYRLALPHLARALEIFDQSGQVDLRELSETLKAHTFAASGASVDRFDASSHRAYFTMIALLDEADHELGELLRRMTSAAVRERGAESGFPDTLALLGQVLARAEQTLPRGHPDRRFLADILMLGGDWVLWMDDDPAGLQFGAAALRIVEEEYGPTDPRTASTALWLADNMTYYGRWAETEELLRPRLAPAREALGRDHPRVRGLEAQLAECAAARGEPDALATLTNLLNGFERQFGRASLWWRSGAARLARALHRADRAAEAEALRLELTDVLLGMPHDSRYFNSTYPHLDLNRVVWKLERFGSGPRARALPHAAANREAAALLADIRISVAAELPAHDPRRVLIARWLSGSADAWEETWGEPETMAQFGDLALELAEPFVERAPFDVSCALMLLARHRECRAGGDLSRAEQLFRRAVALRRKQPGLSAWWTASAESMLANVLRRQARQAEAETWLVAAYERLLKELGADNGNTTTAMDRMLQCCHDRAGVARPAAGQVRAFARLLFGTALGAEIAAQDLELLDLDRRLLGLDNDQQAMRAVLAMQRARIAPEHADLGRLAILAQHWAQAYADAGGALDVGCALTDDFLALLQASPRPLHFAEQRLHWLGALLCETRGDFARGETYARAGLRVAERAGGAGDMAAVLQSELGACLLGQGRLDEAEALLVPAYEALTLYQGIDGGDVNAALRRVVRLHEARGDWPEAARFAAGAMRRRVERDNTRAGPTNDAAWWIVRVPGLPAELYELGLRGAERAANATPQSAAYRNTLGVAFYRAGRFEEAIRALQEANALRVKAGQAEEPADWLFLAAAQRRAGRSAAARMAFNKAQALAAAQSQSPDGQREWAAVFNEISSLFERADFGGEER